MPPRWCIVVRFLFNVAPVQAVEPDTIYSPRVEQGEWELEYKGRYFYDRESDEHRQSQSKFALGYGPTSWWWTELYAEYEHTPGNGGGWSAFEWENRFQFTEPGQYWVDVGALVELERTHPGTGKEVAGRPLAGKGDRRDDVDGQLAGQPGFRRGGILTLGTGVPRAMGVALSAGNPAVGAMAKRRAQRLRRPRHFREVKNCGAARRISPDVAARISGDIPKNAMRVQLEYEF